MALEAAPVVACRGWLSMQHLLFIRITSSHRSGWLSDDAYLQHGSRLWVKRRQEIAQKNRVAAL